MIDYYVREVAMPKKVEGVTVPNDDGSFDIYINSTLPQKRRQAALDHELRHIRAEHFYSHLDIRAMERQADGESINVVLHPPRGKLACFDSPEDLALWLNDTCRHLGVEL